MNDATRIWQRLAFHLGWRWAQVRFLAFCLAQIVRTGRWPAVFFRHGGLGDLICALPSYLALKRAHPRQRLIFACNIPYGFVPKACPGVDCTYVFGRGHGPTPPFLRLLKLLRIKTWRPKTSDEMGMGGEQLHLIEVFQRASGLPLERVQPRLQVNSESIAQARARFQIGQGPVLALHTGRSWRVRELPEETWQEVVDGVRAALGVRLFHFCSPETSAAEVLPVHALRGVEPAGALPLEQTAALIAACQAFIGIDSGLLHLAGSLGIPTIGVFGATDPALRLPPTTPSLGVVHRVPCSFCHHRTPIVHWQSGCPHGIVCLGDMRADLIVEQVVAFLERCDGLHPLAGS